MGGEAKEASGATTVGRKRMGEKLAREKGQMLREKEEPPLQEREHRTHACAPGQSKSSLRGRKGLPATGGEEVSSGGG